METVEITDDDSCKNHYSNDVTVAPIYISIMYRIENWDDKCVKETTSRSKTRNQTNPTNKSSKHWDNPALGGSRRQLSPNQYNIQLHKPCTKGKGFKASKIIKRGKQNKSIFVW